MVILVANRVENNFGSSFATYAMGVGLFEELSVVYTEYCRLFEQSDETKMKHIWHMSIIFDIHADNAADNY